MNIRDIAKLSGVSAATVSRVISNPSSVNQKTRERILAVMEEYHYTPNIFARSLNDKRTNTVGILCSEIYDINHSKIISILEHQLRANGYDSLLCSTGEQIPYNKKFLNLLAQKQVASIMIIGSHYSDTKDFALIYDIARHIPIIVLNGYIDVPGVYNIICDEKKIMRELVMELFQQGCRHLYYLEDNDTYSAYQKRSGFWEGVQACGIKHLCKCISIPIDSDELFHAKKQIELHLSKKQAIDAILSADDILAVGALQALTQAGIQIPVIGFNNSDYAICCTPYLTSVDNRMDFISRSAVDTLLHVLNGEDALEQITVSAKLVERDTYKRPFPASFTIDV